MEGPRWIWNDVAQEWTRAGPMQVALKRLDNSQNISSSYINQVYYYILLAFLSFSNNYILIFYKLHFRSYLFIFHRLKHITNVYDRPR